MLLTALHCAGLATLTHTPNPMRFLNDICGRPENEKPYMILVAGHAAEDATVPRIAKVKKPPERSEERTSELQSLMRISYAVFCLKKKKHNNTAQIIYRLLYKHMIHKHKSNRYQ